jgi:hypothetical protein
VCIGRIVWKDDLGIFICGAVGFFFLEGSAGINDGPFPNSVLRLHGTPDACCWKCEVVGSGDVRLPDVADQFGFAC